MKKKSPPKTGAGQRGAALILILIAVAIFAALSFAVTQSGRGGRDADRERRALFASKIIQYTTGVRAAINRLLLTGCSPEQISFDEHGGTSYRSDGAPLISTTADPWNYVNPNAPSDKRCHVFAKEGGNVTPQWRNDFEGIIDPSVWNLSWGLTGGPYADAWIAVATRVQGLGTEGADGTDLVFMIGRFTPEQCMEINRQVGVDNPGGSPPTNDGWNIGAPFKGAYPNVVNPIGDTQAAVTGKWDFCFSGYGDGNIPYSYTYHSVMIAR